MSKVELIEAYVRGIEAGIDVRLETVAELLAEYAERIKADEGAEKCFCDRTYPDSNPEASCGDCPTRDYKAAQPTKLEDAGTFDMLKHLQRQREWSGRTFGPGSRAQGVVDHIRKELCEVESDPGDLKEWIDVVILALDGAWRSGAQPQEIIDALVAKQTKNEGRVWPDWRTSDPNKAIEHDRSHDVTTTDPPAYWVPVGGIRPGAPAWPGQMEGKAPPDGWVTIGPTGDSIVQSTLSEFVRMPDAERVVIGQQVASRVDEMTAERGAAAERVAELKVVVGGHLQDDDRMSMKTLRWMYEQLDKLTAALQENAK